MSETQDRHRFLEAVRSKAGLLYRWGSNGPFNFDCSGLVYWGLEHVSHFRHDLKFVDMTCIGLANYFDGCQVPVKEAPVGSLIFYGDDDVHLSHVMIVNWRWSPALFGLIGACSGDPSTTTDARAYAQNAGVHTRKGSYWTSKRRFAVDPFHKVKIYNFFSGGSYA